MELEYKDFELEELAAEELRLLENLILEDKNGLCFGNVEKNSKGNQIINLNEIYNTEGKILIYCNGIPIGFLGYNQLTESRSNYSISIAILNDYKKLGIGSSTLLCGIKMLFMYPKIQFIEGRIDETNLASIKSFEKVGFKRKQYHETYYDIENKLRKVIIVSISRSNYEQNQDKYQNIPTI